MNSLYDFIVEPLGDKYSNAIKVDGKELVLNTKIEDFKFVNRLAKVVKTPLAFKIFKYKHWRYSSCASKRF